MDDYDDHDEELAEMIEGLWSARQNSISTAVYDVHGVWLDDLVAPASSGLHASMVEMFSAIMGDLSLSAQDCAMLIWLEIENAISINSEVHFCTDDYHGEDEQ